MELSALGVHPDWRNARRVLAVRLDNLGDVLVTTPAIHAIRRSLPDAVLSLLTSPTGAQAGRLNPDLDRVIPYDAPWTDVFGRLPQDAERELAIIRTLSGGEYDGAVIFTSFRQSPLPAAYLCYLAGIPLRAAASLDGPGSLLTTRLKRPEPPPDETPHEVERGLALVRELGMDTDDLGLVLKTPDESRHSVRRRLSTLGIPDGGPLVVVHPGCSMPARTYPWELYAEAADGLVERLGATVVLSGSEDERALVARVRGRMQRGAVALAGELPFPEFAALIETADLVVTNNTGPMHIAAALQTPVVALFALTNPPRQWGPWRTPHRLLNHDAPCRICYNRACPYGLECLRLVSPSTVVDAAAELLAEVRDARRGGSEARPYAPHPDSAAETYDQEVAV